jgi:hypothetical protein
MDRPQGLDAARRTSLRLEGAGMKRNAPSWAGFTAACLTLMAYDVPSDEVGLQ